MSKADASIRHFIVALDDDGIRLDRWFKRHLPDASFNLVSRWARTGQLRVDGKRAAPGDRILSGQEIRVPPAEISSAKAARPQRKRPELSPDMIEFAQSLVIHKDASALVINKPPGLATQGGPRPKTMLMACLTRWSLNLIAGPNWFTGWTRTPAVLCCLRALRALPVIFPRHFRRAPRARCIGRWWLAYPISTTA